MKKPPASARITAADLQRLQSHLRRTLGCMTLALEAPPTRNGPVQLSIGREVVGTVDQVEDEGERSWAVTLVVLEEDLGA